MSNENMWQFEQKYFANGLRFVAGIDEAGRGPLAGPVCAAAVILPANLVIPGLNDSKKLSDKQRRDLVPIIKENAVAYGIAFSTEAEIDEINILQATFLAMRRAVSQLPFAPEQLLVDGNRSCDFGIPTETIVHGDSLSYSIAAASVLAKVTRDDYMIEQAEKYPQYGFEIHKGYGTKAHYAALSSYGHCPIHRLTFLRKFYGTE